MNDFEIASKAKLKKITRIASENGIPASALELYGNYKAKILTQKLKKKDNGHLILVTAINPTPLGEGKTTISIGLVDGLKFISKKSGLALREPSLGPVFGIKGGAAGGGYSQVAPMEDINLHFTGDISAITAANNLLSAVIDNHIFQGNELDLDIDRIVWRRCSDSNDRSLRYITVGQGGPKDGTERRDGFDITAASEVMAILCLALDIEDLKTRLGNITIGYNKSGKPVYCRNLKAHGAMAVLLKDAIKPNLVQTLEGVPALIHGGPFANIAHGCNSIIATRAAQSMFDYTVTEAGFGADLGAEKFLDVKCRIADLKVSAVVIVATIKALKYNGGIAKDALSQPNIDATKQGLNNLYKHIENIKEVFGLNCVVAINRFNADTDEEIEVVKNGCAEKGIKAVPVTAWGNGGAGAKDLAEEVVRLCDQGAKNVNYTYDLKLSVEEKIETIAKKIYGAGSVKFSDKALAEIKNINRLKKSDLPVIIAKTQYSLSQDAKVLGRPEGFEFEVKDILLRSGSGFIVAIAGSVMLMPGLPKIPASDNMNVTLKRGKYDIKGLF